tara:strand:+ start:368 stop:898 length:531 start_codon:yes stop_codon:yes gene_type:complete
MGKKSNHYIDNKEFFVAMCEWKDTVKESENLGEPRPPISNYIGGCFIKIAEHLAQKPNFMNYPYKDEMINDSIENCLMYAHNFDPEKSKNPFSYFTQIIYYAFLRRIEKEKKQNYIKFKLAEMKDDGTMSSWYKENYFEKDNVKLAMREHFNLSEEDIKRMAPKGKKKKGSTGPFE